MAGITKPVIGVIAPWDATVGKEIVFQYSGNTPVANRATVYNASTMKIVYEQKQFTTSFSHTIAPGVLKANVNDKDGNGNKYCIQIETYDNEGRISYISDKVYFWCLAEPEFYYNTPLQEQKIDTSTAKIDLVYEQENGEKLHSYRHYLYDNTKTIIETTDYYYDDSGMTHEFKGLSNRTAYYVRTEGVTKNGMSVDTGMVRFYTDYYEPDNYEILSLSSDSNATVTGFTNMICIEANEDDDEFVYINSCVQLIGKKITYEHNWKIQRDFSMQIKITKVLNNCVLLTMYNKDHPNATITIDSYVFEDGLRYCLKVFNGISHYVLYTNPLVDIENDDFVVLNLRRINNIYSFEALKVVD